MMPRTEGQKANLLRGERIAGLLQIAFGEGAEALEIQRHAARLVLGGGGGASAHDVAKVVKRAAGHHRIEIEEQKRAAIGGVEEHIADLGVVVDGANGQLAAFQTAHDGVQTVFASDEEFDFPTRAVCAPRRITANGIAEGLKAFRRMVEKGDGFVELAGRKILEQALELAESAAHLPQAIQAVRLQKAEAIDIAVSAPTAAFAIAKEQAAVQGGHEAQNAALCGRAHGGKTRFDMPADAAGILHHLFWMMEGLRAQLLQYVTALRLGEGENPGTVDVADADFLRVHEATGKTESLRSGAQFFGEHAVSSCGHKDMVTCLSQRVNPRQNKSGAAKQPLQMPKARQCILCSCASIIFLTMFPPMWPASLAAMSPL